MADDPASPVDLYYESFEAPRFVDFTKIDTEDDSGVDLWFGTSACHPPGP